jgi:hypothetical protein
MCASEWELGGAVVKRGWCPSRRRVAQSTILREASSDVIGIGSALKILQVTCIASGGQAFVDAGGVALDARDGGMHASEGERSLGVVIENGTGPIRGGVAERAILWESGRYMVRVRGALIILQVARVAGRSQALVNAAGVALHARRGDVFASEREGGLRIVIENRACPVGGGMAE